MDVPATLHGQLYLLAYDRNRHQFDGGNRPLFGFALRAAMLTDLYLTGYLEDQGGKPSQSRGTCPGDPVLRAAFEQPPVGYLCSGIGCSESSPPPVSRSTT